MKDYLSDVRYDRCERNPDADGGGVGEELLSDVRYDRCEGILEERRGKTLRPFPSIFHSGELKEISLLGAVSGEKTYRILSGGILPGAWDYICFGVGQA